MKNTSNGLFSVLVLMLVFSASFSSQSIQRNDEKILVEIEQKIQDEGFEAKISLTENNCRENKKKKDDEALVKSLNELISLKRRYIVFGKNLSPLIYYPKSKHYAKQITFVREIEQHLREIISIFETGKIQPVHLIAKAYLDLGYIILFKNIPSVFRPKKSKIEILEGERIIEKSIVLFEKTSGLFDNDSLTTINYLANHYYTYGKHEHALRHYKVLISRVFPKTSPKLLNIKQIVSNYVNILNLLSDEKDFMFALQELSKLGEIDQTKFDSLDLGLRSYDNKYFAGSGYYESATLKRIPNNTSLIGQPSNTQGQIEITSRSVDARPKGIDYEYKVAIEIDEKGKVENPIVMKCDNEKVKKNYCILGKKNEI